MDPQYAQAARGSEMLANTKFTDPFQATQQARGQLGSFSGANPYAQQLGDYAQTMQQGGSQGIDAVIGNLGSDINRQLQRMLTGAGGVNTQSALAGTLGGGRNEVASGIAQEGALNTFGTQAGQLRLSDYQQRQAQALQAMQAAGGFYGAGQGQQLGAAQALGGLDSATVQAQLAQGLGQGALQTQAGALGFSPFSNQMTLWQQLANVIGPNVSQSTSKGKSESAGLSIGQGG
jgi:hypothetical protein